jgi:hypothetical protein
MVMKQLVYLVVSVSLLLAVVVKQGPDSQLSGRRVSPPAVEAVSALVAPEMALGWVLAGGLLASGLMGGLVYRYSVREFDEWVERVPSASTLRLGVSARTVANQTN